LHDADTYRRGRLRASWRRFRDSPLVQPAVWRQLRAYNRRGFHPRDRDTTALVAFWRDELFGVHGTLNGRLVGSAGHPGG